MALAFHTIKTTLRLLPVVDITKHDHLIQERISHHVLTISHHNKPCKNKLDVLYFVVASFTWLLRASSKNRSYLCIKTTTIFCQVCCFNLQQGPTVVKFDSTKVGETDTRQPPVCKSTSVEPVSWTWSCNVGPGLFIQQCRRIKVRHWWKQYDYYRPQLFVFYSCISSTHRPGLDATDGKRSMQFQKNSYAHARSI